MLLFNYKFVSTQHEFDNVNNKKMAKNLMKTEYFIFQSTSSQYISCLNEVKNQRDAFIREQYQNIEKIVEETINTCGVANNILVITIKLSYYTTK